MKERRTTRRARRLDPRAGNARDSHRPGNVGRQMALSDERRPGEVAKIKRFDLAGLKACVRQRFLPGIHRQTTNVAVRKGPERRLSQAHYCYGSHTTIRIAPGPKDRLHVFAEFSSFVLRTHDDSAPVSARWEY